MISEFIPQSPEGRQPNLVLKWRQLVQTGGQACRTSDGKAQSQRSLPQQLFEKLDHCGILAATQHTDRSSPTFHRRLRVLGDLNELVNHSWVFGSPLHSGDGGRSPHSPFSGARHVKKVASAEGVNDLVPKFFVLLCVVE